MTRSIQIVKACKSIFGTKPKTIEVEQRGNPNKDCFKTISHCYNLSMNASSEMQDIYNSIQKKSLNIYWLARRSPSFSGDFKHDSHNRLISRSI